MQEIYKTNHVASKKLEIFISEPTTVRPDDSISDAIGRMVAKRLNEVFVQLDSRVGIITLRDVLRAGEVSDRKAATLAANPPALTPNDTVSKAAKTMSNLRVQSLPVLDQRGRLLGSVTSTALLRELSSSTARGQVISELMTPRPVTLDVSDSLDKARSIMVERDFDHLPVTRNGKLSGLITSLDVVTTIGSMDSAGRSSRLPEPSPKGSADVGGVLTGLPIISNPPDDSYEVLRSILDRQKTCSTIVSEGMIQGIVTLRDFVRLLAVESDARSQPIYVVGLPENDIESSQAEAKFRRSIEAFGNTFQGLQEARAVVKSSSLEKIRRRFEVQVLIRTSTQQFDFTEEGWSIADVFDKVAEKTKRLMTKPKNSPSHRRRLSREEIQTSKYS